MDPCYIERALPDYAHQGRGGAGNWFSPVEAPKAQFNDPADASLAVASGKPTYSGRGGAGNYNPGNDEAGQLEALKAAEERQKYLEEEALQDIEQKLRTPEKAHLGEGRVLLRDRN